MGGTIAGTAVPCVDPRLWLHRFKSASQDLPTVLLNPQHGHHLLDSFSASFLFPQRPWALSQMATCRFSPRSLGKKNSLQTRSCVPQMAPLSVFCLRSAVHSFYWHPPLPFESIKGIRPYFPAWSLSAAIVKVAVPEFLKATSLQNVISLGQQDPVVCIMYTPIFDAALLTILYKYSIFMQLLRADPTSGSRCQGNGTLACA